MSPGPANVGANIKSGPTEWRRGIDGRRRRIRSRPRSNVRSKSVLCQTKKRPVEKTVTADEQHIGPLAPKAREGRIDLAAGAGVKDLDLQSHSASSGLSLSRIGL